LQPEKVRIGRELGAGDQDIEQRLCFHGYWQENSHNQPNDRKLAQNHCKLFYVIKIHS